MTDRARHQGGPSFGMVRGEEMARPAGIPPQRPAAPSPLDDRRARRELNRLARRLRRRGWSAQARFGDGAPLVRLFDPRVPYIGDSVMVVWDETGRRFRSSTGELLASCDDADSACVRVAELLVPWVLGALGGRPPG
ncbi:hypothetical protein [Actinomadura sp. BRA 177]|uniref:hypothetical protein n=1 Tax=Actinomadura sp. BRA 177 TaxID=2745202 RepID=UPI0015959B18|nr:hypothetical protein [Actinomadura sp. BRA 177]NVI88519.1 hypothetical protein [Actinomadura sp. BRA 177]